MFIKSRLFYYIYFLSGDNSTIKEIVFICILLLLTVNFFVVVPPEAFTKSLAASFLALRELLLPFIYKP